MRLKTNRIEPFAFRNAVTVKDSEGSTSYGWSDAFTIRGVMWSGSGRVQQEKYGARLPMIRNIMLDGKYEEKAEKEKTVYEIDGHTLTVGDGLCYRSDDKPDYIVRAVFPYSHLSLELEHV